MIKQRIFVSLCMRLCVCVNNVQTAPHICCSPANPGPPNHHCHLELFRIWGDRCTDISPISLQKKKIKKKKKKMMQLFCFPLTPTLSTNLHDSQVLIAQSQFYFCVSEVSNNRRQIITVILFGGKSVLGVADGGTIETNLFIPNALGIKSMSSSLWIVALSKPISSSMVDSR